MVPLDLLCYLLTAAYGDVARISLVEVFSSKPTESSSPTDGLRPFVHIETALHIVKDTGRRKANANDTWPANGTISC
jgi:hypothetical protein